MKKKIIKSVLALLLIITLIIGVVIIYYKTVDIKTENPKEIEEIFNVEIKEYSGRKVFIVNPKEQNKSEQTILYIHGGAYMAEVTKDHWDFIKKIVEDTNATVIVPDYPLAPKYTYKEVFNMMEPLYKEIVSKVDMEKFIVMGDSAGGGLALALEEKLSQEEIENLLKEVISKEEISEKYIRDFINCTLIDKNSEYFNMDKIMFIYQYGSKLAKKIAVDEKLKII